ncbi:MAG: MFS transporter [Anaerolineae bacterium]|jgi:GPH family glycoside/pentoside/hexuronide:cation symporter|uniref:MFS transporter n=1 Tax=Candidatus Amarolinea dominans TaxID=3140696 RepID=UPI003136B177|nr:MFS transporter [Anaerolineae bacterium]MBK9231874.1 MFS transporter [Anaerolineae bacterium]
MTTWKKIIYGAGDSGFSLTSTALALLYLDFLVSVVGLDPRLAGISIGLGRIWDAFNDLVIGTLSDRTRSRWGRRRPYLLFGALPFGVAFILMWVVPAMPSQTALLIYYTAMYILFDTFFTLVNVPYIALTPELAPGYDERTSLHSYRMAFSIGFGLLGAVAPLAIVDAIAGAGVSGPALHSAYMVMATLLGLASVLPVWLVFAVVRERPEFQDLPTPGLVDSFRMAASNKAFLIVAGVYLLTWMPIDLIQFVLVFLIRDYFRLDGGARDLIFLLLFGVGVLALPLWVWISHKLDKPRAYQLGMAFLAVVLLALSFMPPGRANLVFLLAALAGIGVSAAHAIPLAILPDVIDWDELRRAQRQEAAYYSVITLIQKLVGAVTITLTGTLLSASGYVANANLVDGLQPATALGTIRFLAGPLPAVFFVAGIILVSFYPITRARHARILSLLAKRRAQRAARLV